MPSSEPHYQRCLAQIRRLSQSLGDELAALSSAEWDAPTGCAPWTVRHVLAHVVRGGEGFAGRIARGLRGSVKPPDPDEGARRESELLVGTNAEMLAALAAATEDFEAQYAGLTDAQLETPVFHRLGNRSLKWFAAHRLAEVAFHRWDIQDALGRAPALDEEVAALLLPTILEQNAPSTYGVGQTVERGKGERFLLAVSDQPDARWLLTIGPGRLTTERGDAPADVTITGSAAALALLAYGRRDLPSLFQERALWLDGDIAIADRFGLIFPKP